MRRRSPCQRTVWGMSERMFEGLDWHEESVIPEKIFRQSRMFMSGYRPPAQALPPMITIIIAGR